jgi:hypothetical protein
MKLGGVIDWRRHPAGRRLALQAAARVGLAGARLPCIGYRLRRPSRPLAARLAEALVLGQPFATEDE